MRICAFRSLYPRIPWSLLLSLLLLPMSPAVVQAASATEATAPNCTQTGLEPWPVVVQLTRTEELVQATLHAPPGTLPAAGCRVPLEFHVPADARPPYAVWRDVEARAMRMDGTPDPDGPDPLSLRLWIRPDGGLQYEVREAGLPATHAALNLAVAWGTTGAANDLAVLDILSAALGLELDVLSTPLVLERYDRNPALGLELDLWELGAGLDDSDRVSHLDWAGVGVNHARPRHSGRLGAALRTGTADGTVAARIGRPLVDGHHSAGAGAVGEPGTADPGRQPAHRCRPPRVGGNWPSSGR